MEENGAERRRLDIYVDAFVKDGKGEIGILIRKAGIEEKITERYEGELDQAEKEEDTEIIR